MGCLLGACSAADGTVLRVRATQLPACAATGVTLVQLEALDDATPGPASFVEVRPDVGQDLPDLPATAALFLARARSSDGEIRAHGLLARAGDEAVGALFPVDRVCGLSAESGGANTLVPPLGAVVAGSLRQTLIVGGVSTDGVARADVLVLDGVRGEVFRLGMRRRRSSPAVAFVGDRAIVAGGEADGAVWEDAEIVDLGSRPPAMTDALALSEPRSHATAVVLGGGGVLLVGGGRGTTLSRALEVIDPGLRTTTTLDLASLSRGRLDPVVVRLATGEIAVAGGTDASGAPVPDVELLSADARTSARLDVAATTWITGYALPSGAALLVRGEPLAKQWQAALLRADGSLEALAPVDAGPSRPVLVAATDGAPFLWDGALRRYDPWAGRFVATTIASSASPLPLGQGALAFASPTGLTALRFDLRHRLASDETLGLGSTQHLVPDPLTVLSNRTGLVLPGRARVAVADTDYGTLHLRVAVGGFRELPAIELRTPLGVLVARIAEDGACRYPTAEGDALDVDRAADGSLTLRIGTAEARCTAPPGRVLVTLVAQGRDAVVRGFTLRR